MSQQDEAFKAAFAKEFGNFDKVTASSRGEFYTPGLYYSVVTAVKLQTSSSPKHTGQFVAVIETVVIHAEPLDANGNVDACIQPKTPCSILFCQWQEGWKERLKGALVAISGLSPNQTDQINMEAIQAIAGPDNPLAGTIIRLRCAPVPKKDKTLINAVTVLGQVTVEQVKLVANPENVSRVLGGPAPAAAHTAPAHMPTSSEPVVVSRIPIDAVAVAASVS